MICSVYNCEQPTLARGWCSMHYARWHRQGSTSKWKGGPRPRRFDYITKPGCREWMGQRDSKGYGVLSRGGQPQRVHRWVWRLANGPVLDGRIRGMPGIKLYVCHHCDNPPCFFLEHLYLGTHADNMADMKARRRQAQGGNDGQ
jgi:HNH endonuclease